MQSSASSGRRCSIEEVASAAPSSTAPPAVTHEWSGCGERKKLRAGNDVCVSSTSTNQSSQFSHTSMSRSSDPSTLARTIISTPLGGDPARTSSLLTAASLRENAAYRLGREVINNARIIRPSAAPMNRRTGGGESDFSAKPRVKSDEPLIVRASRNDSAPSAQNIAAN